MTRCKQVLRHQGLAEDPYYDSILIYPPNNALVHVPNATGSVSITNADLNRLAPNEFLNDTLVEYGMK